MASKQELLAQLKDKGIEADASLHPATLQKMLNEVEQSTMAPEDIIVDNTPNQVQTPAPTVPAEGYMKVSDVKALIAEALAAQKAEGTGPVKVKKVTEHMAHVWRLDGKWVVDFKDRNDDPYRKEKLHAYQVFNDRTRQFEAWIEVVFEDGSTKPLPLTTYVKNRVLVYCPIIKRHQIDKSYTIGEVEKKKEEGDKLVGTGILVDQDVTLHEEIFEVKVPGGTIFKLPSYVIA